MRYGEMIDTLQSGGVWVCERPVQLRCVQMEYLRRDSCVFFVGFMSKTPCISETLFRN